MDQDSVH